MKKCSQCQNNLNYNCETCILRLSGKTLFYNVPSSLLQEIEHVDEHISINTKIYEENESNTYLYSITKGIVKLSITDASYKTRATSLLTAGMSFGLEVINKSSYLQNATSITPVKVCKIKLAREQINESKSLLENTLKKWQENITNQNQIIEKFSMGDTHTRIIRLFHYLKENSPLEEKNNFYLPRLEDISSIVNVSKENCSRALSKIKKMKEIILVDKKSKIYKT
ncbi:cAMP-binding protein - catabolite gene activator and regulatory subunit of cAMP-dependent protein kinase [hydrothermal vent metagenome]|uniref:cAMP-binding protein - catabolite gene activator and regulatory subunit of cAMP-dependent protein kinase n=1 Tax=hydrothermal vent metagenome TaxID=652676 RepID=A0A3B1E2N2_9ZZZZ